MARVRVGSESVVAVELCASRTRSTYAVLPTHICEQARRYQPLVAPHQFLLY